MIERSPPPREVVRYLFATIAPPDLPPDVLLGAVERAYSQLRDRMMLLLGQAGFDALWTRALHQVQPGTVGLPMLVNGYDPAVVRDRVVAVFTNCFTLLYTFIGDELSFRLIRQTWPTVSFHASAEQAEGAN